MLVRPSLRRLTNSSFVILVLSSGTTDVEVETETDGDAGTDVTALSEMGCEEALTEAEPATDVLF